MWSLGSLDRFNLVQLVTSILKIELRRDEKFAQGLRSVVKT